jgi:hypothetical protein
MSTLMVRRLGKVGSEEEVSDVQQWLGSGMYEMYGIAQQDGHVS